MEETGGDIDVTNERAKYHGSKENCPAGSPKHFKKPSTAVETFNVEMTDNIDGDGDGDKKDLAAERSRWVLDGPKPPGLCEELMDSVRETIASCKHKYHSSLKNQSFPKRLISIQKEIFPILAWGREYKIAKFKSDLMAGLTIASLCIPQVKSKNIYYRYIHKK